MRPIVLVLAFIFLLPIVAANHGDVSPEVEETSAPPYQRTCVSDAQEGSDESGLCERVFGLGPYPREGTAILDAMLWSPGLAPAHPDARLSTGAGAWSASRETGVLPNAVWPGIVHAVAFYGFWSDENGNGVIDQEVFVTGGSFKGYGPSNEFLPAILHSPYEGELVGFVDPGSHPPVTESSARPGFAEPDFRFGVVESATRLRRADSPFVFVDGSILDTYHMETVSEAVLVPDPGTGRHYRAEPWSRVDVDTYLALAPFPIDVIYQGTLAPIVRSVGSPGFGACPEQCTVPPFPHPAAGPVAGLVWAPYEDEVDPRWMEDPRRASTNAGRGDEYESRYAGWIDLLPALVTPHGGEGSLARVSPLPGLGIDEEDRRGLAVPRGSYFAAEVRTGLWHDANGDGVIGDAGGDAYESGNRPIPHRYHEPGQEFVAAQTTRPGEGWITVLVTLTPDDTWGSPGLFRVSPSGSFVPGNDCDVVADPCVSSFAPVTGSTPVVVEAWPVHDGRQGHLLTQPYLLFPTGTVEGGFTVCTEARRLTFREGGIDVEETLADCDHVERLVA